MTQSSYRDIKAEVLSRIHSRQWPPGQIIPPETDLAREFGCARATINRALRELAQSGILDRRRKAGTRVRLNPVRKATLDIPVIRLEIEARNAVYRHQVLENTQTAAPDDIAERLHIPRTHPVLHLTTLHLADDQPAVFEDRWINPAAAPGILTASLSDISANEWLVQNVPATGGEIGFMAETATAISAAALGISEGAALFVVERLTWFGSDAVTSVRLAYPPGYRMTTRI